MNTDTRLQLFREMIGCCHNLYLWSYDSSLCLLTSNCPAENTVNTLLAAGGHQETLLQYAYDHQKPAILTNIMGLMWVAAPEKDEGKLRRIHVLGPFFTDDTGARRIESQLYDLHLSAQIQRQVMAFLQELPIISLNRIFEYAIMLHYCVTGKRSPPVTCTTGKAVTPSLPPWRRAIPCPSTAPTKRSRRCSGWSGRVT